MQKRFRHQNKPFYIGIRMKGRFNAVYNADFSRGPDDRVLMELQCI